MAASLQAKVQLLAICLVVFTLLAAPIFYQEADDYDASKDTAKNTFFSKFFRDLVKNMKGESNPDVDVEDYWGELQRQNPNCGPECDPEGDLDGDGVKNADELKNGTNPACNEEELGAEYCRSQDPYHNVQNQTQTHLPPRTDILFSDEFSFSNPPEKEFTTNKSIPYHEWVVFVNATNYSGFYYRVVIENKSSNSVVCCEEQQRIEVTGTTINEPKQRFEPAPAHGTYRVRFPSDDNNVLDGTRFTITILGVFRGT